MPATPALGAFVRFCVVGVGTTVLATGIYQALIGLLPLTLLTAVTTASTTLLSTEANGRYTFRAGPTGWRRHVLSAASVLGAYLLTTGALLATQALLAEPSRLVDQLVYLGASGVAGLGRFLVLSRLVFPTPADGAPVDGAPAVGARAVGAASHPVTRRRSPDDSPALAGRPPEPVWSVAA